MYTETKDYKENWKKAQRARLKSGCENNSYIYLHLNADDDVPHHVGMGNTINRPWEMKNSRSNKHKNKTTKHGVRVEIISDELTKEAAKFWEIAWIKALKDTGYELTNLTDGGEGTLGLVHAEETKLLLTELKRKIDRETLFKIYSDNRKDADIAADYGMGRRVLSQIKSGRRYKEDLEAWISVNPQWESIEDFVRWRKKDKNHDLYVSVGKKRRRLNKETVFKILEDPRTYFKIAADHNMSFQNVGRIKSGIRYKEWFDEWRLNGEKQWL
jgi:hypothetical protein